MGHLSCRRSVAAAFVVVLTTAASELSAQTVGTSGVAPDPRAVLWTDPGDIATRDLFWGMGSAERAPKGPFTFVEDNSDGTQPKIVVTDANGVTWDVKFGDESKAEVAANRFVWAVGYPVEELYFVGTGVIQGVKDPGRSARHIAPEGNFMNARFRRRNDHIVRADEQWTLKDNPFGGQKELSGFMILMTMLSNWDIGGTRNTRVLRVTMPDGTMERQFTVTDLGATFGRMGGPISNHSKWDLEGYLKEGFIEKVADGVLHLDYDGAASGVDRVPLEHARWFAGVVSKLTEEQVRRAFEAAGATPQEIEGFSKRFMEKIGELQAAIR